MAVFPSPNEVMSILVQVKPVNLFLLADHFTIDFSCG